MTAEERLQTRDSVVGGQLTAMPTDKGTLNPFTVNLGLEVDL